MNGDNDVFRIIVDGKEKDFAKKGDVIENNWTKTTKFFINKDAKNLVFVVGNAKVNKQDQYITILPY